MNILDPKFKYVPAAQTDIGKTFKRIRKQLRDAEKQPAKPINVAHLKRSASK